MDTMSFSDLVGATVSRLRLVSEERRLGARLHETLRIDLPLIDGVGLAARYRSANSSVAAGGDFVEVCDLSGAVAVVIGDVVGHGVDAAVRSVQLRSDLATALHVTRDPAAALRVLDDRSLGRGDRCIATAMCVLIDLDLGVAEIATAGHPPPLVVAPDRSSRWLRLPSGPPVGVAGERPPSARVALHRDDIVLCFTDGVIERPGALLDDGVAHLAERVVGALGRSRGAGGASTRTDVTADPAGGEPGGGDVEVVDMDVVVDAAIGAALEYAEGRDDAVVFAFSRTG